MPSAEKKQIVVANFFLVFAVMKDSMKLTKHQLIQRSSGLLISCELL